MSTAFGPQQIISTSADGAFSVFAADLDGDGDQDVISASRHDGKIAWYEKTGADAGITVSSTSGLTTTEAGDTDTFTVVLDSQPTADVAIAISSSDTGEGSVSPDTLTFTSANWDTARTVTVTGVDDSEDDGDQSYTVTLGAASSSDSGYNSLDPDDVAVTNTDDDLGPAFADTPAADTLVGTAADETVTLLEDGENDSFDAAGGIDTLDLSGLSADSEVDLVGGTVTSSGSGTDQITGLKT